jgi:hypothetical protein
MPDDNSTPLPGTSPYAGSPSRNGTAPASSADLYPRIAPRHELVAYIGHPADTRYAAAFGLVTGTASLARDALQKGADTAYVLEEVLRTVEALSKRLDELLSPLAAPRSGA